MTSRCWASRTTTRVSRPSSDGLGAGEGKSRRWGRIFSRTPSLVATSIDSLYATTNPNVRAAREDHGSSLVLLVERVLADVRVKRNGGEWMAESSLGSSGCEAEILRHHDCRFRRSVATSCDSCRIREGSCSSCLMFMCDPPIDLPTRPRREDAAERAALTEAAPLLPGSSKRRRIASPFPLQDAAPFCHRRRRALEGPPPARGPRSLEASPGRILVDGLDDGPGEREAPLIYLVMGLHGRKCSTPERSIQSVVALSVLPDFPSPLWPALQFRMASLEL